MNTTAARLLLMSFFVALLWVRPVGAGTVFTEGTIFLEPNVITENDPTAFVSLRPAGQEMREMYDRRGEHVINVEAFLFVAEYEDGLEIEIQVNPEFGTVEKAQELAEYYAPVFGRLPYVLRKDVETSWIHAGGTAFGGGNNNLLVHTGIAQTYIDDGILEEALVHEAAHTSLDADHATSAGWVAQEFWEREDVAETYLTYLAQKYRADRISAANLSGFRAVPARNAYFDGLGWSLYPLVGAKPVPGAGWYKLKTEAQGNGKCLESNQVESPPSSLQAPTTEGAVFKGASFLDNCQNVSGQGLEVRS